MQFIVFEKFKSVFVHQIAREIVLLLVNIVHVKTAQRVMTDEILNQKHIISSCTLSF